MMHEHQKFWLDEVIRYHTPGWSLCDQHKHRLSGSECVGQPHFSERSVRSSFSFLKHKSFLVSGASIALANDCGLFYKQSVNYVLEVVIKISHLSGLSTRTTLGCHILIEDLNCNDFFFTL